MRGRRIPRGPSVDRCADARLGGGSLRGLPGPVDRERGHRPGGWVAREDPLQVAQGNNFSGTWKETTRQVDGKVTGRVPAPGEFQASLEGTGFGIQLSATTNGKQQAVTIQSQGTDVQTVKISLRKA